MPASFRSKNHTPRVISVSPLIQVSGKEDLRTAATKLSQSLGCMQLIMNVSSFTSDAGVHAAIVTQPQSLALIDEFGKVFEAMSSSVLNQNSIDNTDNSIHHRSLHCRQRDMLM